jgi:16S rRNA processing protein RimM
VTNKFIVGQIGAPFGVKGFVKVRSFSGEIDHLLKLDSVIVNKDGSERVLCIEESAPSFPGLIMRFAGIDNPESAKTLGGAQLIGSRDQATPLNKGEFYIEDLKGLPVVTENNEVIGSIFDIIEGGGGELAEVKLNSGVKHMVPFRKEFFLDVSLEKKRAILQNLWILDT